MKASIIALSLISGCAYGVPIDGIDIISEPGSDNTEVNTDSLIDAAANWGIPLPSEDWIEINAPEDTVSEVCIAAGAVAGIRYQGCTIFPEKRVWIASELNPEVHNIVLLHEVGHLLAGRSDHLTTGCGPSHETSHNLMCKYAAMVEPTAVDYEYVNSKPTPTCTDSPAATDTTVQVLHNQGGVWCTFNK